MNNWTPERRKAYDKERNARLMPQKMLRDSERRAELRAWFSELKSKLSCGRCPENHPACLQFHHLRDKTTEVGNMVNRGYAKERIVAEIEKCVVLCSNCHAKEHYREIP